jgi:hypothetical protein
MKKLTIILSCVFVFLLGSALGYCVGIRGRIHNTGKQMEIDQLENAQFAVECEARGYFYCLQALDSGRSEDISNLRQRAMRHLRGYVQEVHYLRGLGYTWTPVNNQLYTNATIYLAAHPRTK